MHCLLHDAYKNNKVYLYFIYEPTVCTFKRYSLNSAACVCVFVQVD